MGTTLRTTDRAHPSLKQVKRGGWVEAGLRRRKMPDKRQCVRGAGGASSSVDTGISVAMEKLRIFSFKFISAD